MIIMIIMIIITIKMITIMMMMMMIMIMILILIMIMIMIIMVMVMVTIMIMIIYTTQMSPLPWGQLGQSAPPRKKADHSWTAAMVGHETLTGGREKSSKYCQGHYIDIDIYFYLFEANGSHWEGDSTQFAGSVDEIWCGCAKINVNTFFNVYGRG